MGVGRKREPSITEIVPCCQIIIVNYGVIEGIGKYVMPFPDINLVDGKN
jgi:hypothetical protein